MKKILIALLLVGCAGAVDVPPDVGVDAGFDSGQDAGVDATCELPDPCVCEVTAEYTRHNHGVWVCPRVTCTGDCAMPTGLLVSEEACVCVWSHHDC